MNLDSIHPPVLFSGLLRLIVYGILVVLTAEFIYWDALQFPIETRFSEESWTEKLQEILLIMMTFTLLIIALSASSYKYVAWAMFSFTGSSFIRELDSFLDTLLFYGAWQVGVFSLIAVVVPICIIHFRAFSEAVKKYVHTLSFGLFLSGILTTYVFSRLFGRKIFWYTIMEEHYIRAVKNAAEECLELFGYLLMTFAVLEFILMVFISGKKRVEKEQHKEDFYLLDT